MNEELRYRNALEALRLCYDAQAPVGRRMSEPSNLTFREAKVRTELLVLVCDIAADYGDEASAVRCARPLVPDR